MQILERPEQWTHEAYCLFCKAKLLIEEGDVCYDEKSAIDMARTTPFFFRCAICRANNPLDNLPAHVQHATTSSYGLIR